MSKYTHRQRVITALNHQQPDRIPLDMMGNATMLLDKTYFRLRDYLGLSPIEPVRSGSSANYYDERILEHLDIDFRRVFLAANPNYRAVAHDDGSFTDPWGIRYKRDGLFVSVIDNPLHGMTTVEQVDAFQWPKAKDMFTAEGLAETARHMFNETDYAIVARNPITAGFLDRANQLMEMSEFLMLMAASPDVAHCIIGHLLAIYKDIYTMFLDAVGPYVQMVEAADDIGTQNSLLVSPEMYREFIKPAEKELYSLIRQKSPSAAIFRHTDGAVFDLIPDFLEVGVNVLNPVQTSTAGMDQHELKRTYGDKITFHGAVEKMESTTDECIAEVKERIDTFAPGGGYVFASCNHMIDVSPENIISMFKTAKEYGHYE